MEPLINFIIRPPRAEYDPKNDLLDQEFMLKGKWFQRKDIEVKNSRGDILQCSHYMPVVRPEGKPLPCVIYCHGNSGCRADASEAAIILLPSNISVFTLDFSGSGLSGGEHVTLGWNEKDDLTSVVEFLRADGNVSLIGLWGRSMGAVTSLMYGAEDPSIAGMVLDSPFSDLVELMMELVDTYKIRLPKFTVKFAIQYMRRAILKKAKFDISELNTIKVAKSCFVPVLFGHAVDDDFIQPHHADRIYEAYVGDKNIIKFEGDHNSPRPQFYFDSINIFFHNVLQPPEDEVGETFLDTTPDYFSRGRWSTLPEMGYTEDDFFTTGRASSTTEDAIEQLRSKRQMSRIEVPSDISSQDKPAETEEGSSSDKQMPSSSNMISFELSDGQPNGPRVPASIDYDDYLEYSFDNLSHFPSNSDEEERMFREAVMESIKDMEKTSNTKQDENFENLNSVDTSVPPSSSKPDNSANKIIQSGDDQIIVSTGPSPSAPPVNTVSSSSNGVETIDFTKATVTVERNPSSNMIDGLLKRWDLSFFRGNNR
ncbi:uncharacterized protein LOC124941502 [Impatiens glandulifera]|uniref:uncharacterized protein LOC124941502 n=1 Tax=Impatiens glandulifera TaxID=253017 RepID=UPI001FB0CA69|nr:uncharacterized protein LOC124941502 [Impatiens glandulifera]